MGSVLTTRPYGCCRRLANLRPAGHQRRPLACPCRCPTRRVYPLLATPPTPPARQWTPLSPRGAGAMWNFVGRWMAGASWNGLWQWVGSALSLAGSSSGVMIASSLVHTLLPDHRCSPPWPSDWSPLVVVAYVASILLERLPSFRGDRSLLLSLRAALPSPAALAPEMMCQVPLWLALGDGSGRCQRVMASSDSCSTYCVGDSVRLAPFLLPPGPNDRIGSSGIGDGTTVQFEGVRRVRILVPRAGSRRPTA
jgi:hypothetical protein